MKNKKRLIAVAVVIVAVLAAVFGGYMVLRNETVATEVTREWAEAFVNEEFDKMAKTNPAKYIAEKNEIVVEDISYGDEKDIILECSVTTADAYAVISEEYDKFLSADVKKDTMFKSALDFKLEFNDGIIALLETAPEKTLTTQIVLYDTKDNGVVLYASDEAVNAVFGGMIDVKNEVSQKTTYTKINPDGTEEAVKIETNNVVKGFVECIKPVYNSSKPDTAGAFGKFINKQKKDFYQNFILYNRWQSILKGLGTTLQITLFALIIGVLLGFLVAFVRCAHMKVKKKGFLLNLFNGICQLYLTIIRGTPVVVQILIIHFVILQPLGINSFVSAFICFGVNSGAYVAEIVRGGIMSVDEGQTEAGRSLGFNYVQTMVYIILPQAFKTVLPSLANEFVVLLKETSIAFYIGVADMMYEVVAIRSATYSAFMPLIASAVIYLILVLTFSKLVNILERRMRNSER